MNWDALMCLIETHGTVQVFCETLDEKFELLDTAVENGMLAGWLYREEMMNIMCPIFTHGSLWVHGNTTPREDRPGIIINFSEIEPPQTLDAAPFDAEDFSMLFPVAV